MVELITRMLKLHKDLPTARTAPDGSQFLVPGSWIEPNAQAAIARMY